MNNILVLEKNKYFNGHVSSKDCEIVCGEPCHKKTCLLDLEGYTRLDTNYRKVPKFSYVRNLCCNLPKIQTKRPNLRVFHQKAANGIASSEDPDQTAPLGAV